MIPTELGTSAEPKIKVKQVLNPLKSRAASYLRIVTMESKVSSCFGPVMTAKLLKSIGVIFFLSYYTIHVQLYSFHNYKLSK